MLDCRCGCGLSSGGGEKEQCRIKDCVVDSSYISCRWPGVWTIPYLGFGCRKRRRPRFSSVSTGTCTVPSCNAMPRCSAFVQCISMQDTQRHSAVESHTKNIYGTVRVASRVQVGSWEEYNSVYPTRMDLFLFYEAIYLESFYT